MAVSRLPNVLGATLALLACTAALLFAGGARAQVHAELGDVDCSGAVDSVDAALTLQRVAGLVATLPCDNVNDVDEDGAITSLDASFILQYTARLIPVLPAPSIALANIPTHCPQQAQLTDGAIMATDIMTRSSHDLLLNRGLRIDMGIELDGVLGLVRAAEPAVVGIHPITMWQPGRVGVIAGPALYAFMLALLANSPDSVDFVTGNDGFDALNVRLRLQGFETLYVSPQPPTLAIFLCYPYFVNVVADAQALAALDGITSANPIWYATDSSDIEGTKDGDTWYLAFRDASGDCTAGCIDETLYYFTVTSTTVTRIDEAAALNDPRFTLLACFTRHAPDCQKGIP
jgi:hypothetical protein